jgi:hypothetical protein
MIMPRLAFEEPKGGPAKKEPTKHRRETRPDGVVVVLKAATFAIVVALVGAVVLLLTAGGGDERAAEGPDVPKISGSAPAPTTTTTPLAAIIAPEVRSDMTEIVPTVPSTTQPTVPSTEPPPTGGQPDQFVELGDRCETRGAYAFTRRYEPVVCERGGRGQQLVWRRLFR